jgi:aminoacrylate peracid reductase
MPGTRIIPEGSPPPLAPYSPGMKVGDAIFVAGTIALDAEGKVVGKGDISLQTEQVIKNIRDVLQATGAGLEDIVMMHIFITDFNNYAPMNEVYAKYFSTNPPARFCVKCELVKPEFLIEMAAIAVVASR